MGDPEIYSCREWQQERFMPSNYREDVLRRAEANMYKRRENEEADAVSRMLNRSEEEQLERERAAWTYFFILILAGCLTAMVVWITGVQQ
jgi:hypothetical protein